MNSECNNSGVFPVDLRQMYVGHKTLPLIPVVICVRKLFNAANMRGVARAKLPTLLSDGSGNWDVCAYFIKTAWCLTQTDRQADRRTDGQSCHQTWQALASQRSVLLDSADRTKALRNSLCTAASMYGGYSC